MVALAAPLVATTLGISTTAATIGTSVAMLAGTTALQYFLAQQSQQSDPDRGRKLEVALGGAVPQSIIFGETETAGHLAYAGTWGVSGQRANNYAVRVYVLADYPIDDMKSMIWYGGRKCTINWGETRTVGGVNIGSPVTTLRKGGKDYLWVKFLSGRQTTPENYLRTKFGGAATRPYTADMVGYGRPIAIVTARYDKEGAGLQEPLFALQGMWCYDPRKDSTNGGSGSHRWDNPATHEFTKNAAVIYYHIRRGVYYDGERLFGGLNYPAYMLDNDTYFAAMNTCDVNVTLAGGGTEKQFEAGGEIDISGRVSDVLDRLLAVMNGRVVEDGGTSRLYCGAIGASVFSFTDDDIVFTEPEDGEDVPSSDDIFNTVTGTYTEPGDAGQVSAFRKKTNADALARDGEEITKAIDLSFCRRNSQGQRVAKMMADEGQRWKTRGIVLPPFARGKLQPVNVNSWTSDENGWSAKKFIDGDVTPMRDGNVQVRLREADPADGGWTTGDEDSWDTGTYDDLAPDPEEFTATITAISLTDDAGNNRRPGIRFVPSATVLGGAAWADIKDEFEDCEALFYTVRKKLGAQKVIARGRLDDFFEDGEDDITRASFLPGLQVQVQYRIKLASGRFTAWSGWTDITLTNARLKIQTDTDDNDIDLVLTENIETKQIWSKGSFPYAKSDPDEPGGFVSISGGGGDKKSDSNIGNITISNPNKTPVFINFEYDIVARTSSGIASLDVTLYGRDVALRTVSATAKNTSGDATSKIDTANGKIVVMDADWADGDSANRTYKVGMVLERSSGGNAGGRVYGSRVTLTWGLR